jgi:hypothetical protein
MFSSAKLELAAWTPGSFAIDDNLAKFLFKKSLDNGDTSV